MAPNEAEDITFLVRDRETHRHLDFSYIHGYVDDAADTIPPARPSRDSALTAFTQLALLRLGAHRAFVSLLDRRYQYVIAETTATSGLRRSAHESTDEGLILSGLAFPYKKDALDHVLPVASDGLSAETPRKDGQRILPVSVIPDAQADDRIAESRLIKAYKDVRFYVAVPIRSPTGLVIGVLSVTDQKPRTSMSDADVCFLRDMSLTVMDHLSMIRTRQDEARGKRMMRGLGSFVEGMSTMSGFVTEPWSARSGGDAGQEGMLNRAQQAKMQEESDTTDPDDSPSPQETKGAESYFDHVAVPRAVTSGSSTSDQQQPTEDLSPLSSKAGPARSSKDATHADTDQSRVSSPSTKSPPVDTSPSPAPSKQQTNDLFARAANVIRESIEVEGVLFFDASISTYESAINTDHRDNSDSAQSQSSQDSSDEGSVPSIKSGRSARSLNEKMCHIFGFSTTRTASIDGDKADTDHLAVPERFLHLLLRRYPKGKIFNFDEHGIPLSDTESDSDHDRPAGSSTATHEARPINRRRRHQSYTRRQEPSFIIKIFPNARSVITFPLWDSHKARWYAGGVAWTRTPTRVFSVKSELSYLRAFGATIMAEMAKIDAQQAEQAKTDVLGSISHELRSPLHGILGGVELLQQTKMDAFQGSAILTIERCGMTLLDTVSHLLDYAKVNNLLRTSNERRRTKRLQRPMLSREDSADSSVASWDVDIDNIIEEVVESVFAGHEFETLGQSRRSLQIDSAKSYSQTKDPAAGAEPVPDSSAVDRIVSSPVKVILDIREATNWTFSTQAGAIRRIVMNVFGNALKFTTTGRIIVRVDQKDIFRRGKHLTEVTITIEDTGRGISKEYLAHHLFTPFFQENSLSTGTGLGLSITHKVITSLGGTIAVQSKVGQGTAISIGLPLIRSLSTEPSFERASFNTLIERFKGLRVCLSGFDELLTSTATLDQKLDQADVLMPKAAIAHTCEVWLGMEVLSLTQTDVKPDVYLATVKGAEALSDLNRAGTITQPVVVICPNGVIARDLCNASTSMDGNGFFEYIAQPFGPRKLAKAFTIALDRWSDAQIERASSNPPSMPEPSQDTAAGEERVASPRTPFQNPVESSSEEQTSLPLRPMNRLLESPRLAASTIQRQGTPVSASTSLDAIAPYLVVDDNPINVKLLSTFLRQQNLPVETATDGAMGLETYQAANGVFSCVFMDIQMPRMDGIAATRAIREYEGREKLPATHIVVLTGLATTENVQNAKASGANDFFPKPVRLKELKPIITQARRTPSDET